MKPRFILPSVVFAMFFTNALKAEEGGTGHYLPGTAASGVDSLPGKPAWAVLDYFIYYDGNTGTNCPFNIAGTVASGFKGKRLRECGGNNL